MKKVIVLFFFLIIFFFPAFTFAISAQELATKISNLIQNTIKVGVVFAFLSLVWGGFLYLTSAGNVEKINQAKKQILSSFIGLVLLLTSFIILSLFKPEFTVISPEEIPTVNFVASAPTTTEASYLLNTEIPIETYLKGLEGKEKETSFFSVTELSNVTSTIKAIKDAPLFENLKDNASLLEKLVATGCSCGNTQPKGTCPGVCIKKCSLIFLFCWCESQTCATMLPEPQGCTCDPCQNVRNQINEKLEKNLDAINEISGKNGGVSQFYKKLEELLASLEKNYERLILAIKKLRECPFEHLYSRDNYISLRDFFVQSGEFLEWTMIKTPLYQEFPNLRSNSFADFYCPKSSFHSLLPPYEKFQEMASTVEAKMQAEWSTTSKELEKWARSVEFQLKEKLSAEYELPEDCQFSIPFGEIMDKLLKRRLDLINVLKEFLKLRDELIEKIHEFNKSITECSSKNCSASCKCGENLILDQLFCFCHPYCHGDPCPTGEIKANMEAISGKIQEIKKKAEEIEKIVEALYNQFIFWPEIEREVRQRGLAFNATSVKALYEKYEKKEKDGELKEIVAFEIMAARMHYCVAQPLEIRAGWHLNNCELNLGNLNPDNQLIKEFDEKRSQCFCSTTKECQTFFPILKDYTDCKIDFEEKVEDATGNIIKIRGCNLYNFLCCRRKETD